jgi:hypothetical protein
MQHGTVISFQVHGIGPMTDVPEILLEQIQQRVVAMWMGSFYGSSGYIARKLGKKGLREFHELGARQVAATFKHLGLAEPGEIALAIATNEKNLFGSQVDVVEGEGWAEIRRSSCGLVEGAKAFARVGAFLLAKEHCKTCFESHWKKVFLEMGLGVECENTEFGCIMKVSKISEK